MYKKKGSWSLIGTKLPGKVGVLVRDLVETITLTSIQKLCFLGYH
jgi:hypothetical protein